MMNKELEMGMICLGKIYDDFNVLNLFYLKWEKCLKRFNNTEIEIYCEALTRLIDDHRVLTNALTNISFLLENNNNSLLFILKRNIVCELEKWKSTELTQLYNAVDIIGLDDFIAIKGSAMSQIYPESYIRYQVDFDLIVSNISDLWRILDKSSKYYSYNRLKIYIKDINKFSASIDLIPKNSTYPPIDIHIAPFYIWGGIHLDIDLDKNKQSINGVNIPSNENILLILLAHLANQWMYRLRDINDMYVLITTCTLNWDYIISKLEKNNLVPFMKIILTKLEEVYQLKVENYTFSKLKSFEKAFMNKNFGIPNVYSACRLHYFFTYQNYKQDFSIFYSVKNSLLNCYNLILFKNRAFKVNKKLKIKKWKGNQIFTLKFVEKKVCSEEDRRRKLDTNFYIVKEQTADEYFVGNEKYYLKQSSYYVK